jgi:hypothetical protein
MPRTVKNLAIDALVVDGEVDEGRREMTGNIGIDRNRERRTGSFEMLPWLKDDDGRCLMKYAQRLFAWSSVKFTSMIRGSDSRRA